MEQYAEPTQQEFEGWEEFYSKLVDEKLDFFQSEGRLFDVIFAQQFERGFLDLLCNLADMIRVLAETGMGLKNLEIFCLINGSCFILYSRRHVPSYLFKMPVIFWD